MSKILRDLLHNFRNKYPEANHDKFRFMIDHSLGYGYIEWKYNRMMIMSYDDLTSKPLIDDLSPRLKRLLWIDLGLDDDV